MSETLQFKTELKQLLHLIIHSLYSHKDIFLRELISNASDAIDTVRFQSLTNADLLEGDSDWKIRIVADEANGTLTVSDNGIGMARATIVENLGTIAKSGTRALLENLKEAQAQNRPDLIGQFGVGFYASFMVADKVTVISRTAGKPEDGVQWESDGQGEFSVESVTKEKRGTDVILHLRADCKEYLQFWRIGQLVKKYSDFVEHPIVMKKEAGDGEQKSEVGEQKSEEETLNAMKAIWLRPRTEVTQEEYDAFYKHLSHDPEKAVKTIHYSAEGAIEFKALLYLPGHKPFDLMWGDKPKGLHLYIQRVFILDDYEILLPRYLRFVRGVVDSPDLPLNVSRELLQQSAPLEKIKTNLVNKILNTLDEMKKREYDEYVKFYEEMGVFLKEGVGQDWTNREKLAELLLFESTKTEKGKYTSLSQYMDNMPVNQPEIFYLTGDSRELMEQSPHLEAFREKGWEVLLLADPVDEFVVDSFHEYKGKKLKAVDKGGLDAAAVEEDKKKQYQPLLDYFKEKIADIKEARLTGRLKESAVCLVAEEGDMSAHMERLMQRMGRDRRNSTAPVTQRILEVNAEHPLIQNLSKIVDNDPKDARLEKTCRLLYDQAVITEGSKVKDPLAFAGRLNELIMKELGN